MTSQLASTSRDRQLLRHYVNGEFVESGTSFANLSPVDGRKLADVCEADAALVDSAIRAAHAAQRAGWRDTTPAQRAVWLHKIADGIEARFDEFVAAEVADTGRPVAQARTLDIARGIANFRTFADLVRTASGEYFETHAADANQNQHS